MPKSRSLAPHLCVLGVLAVTCLPPSRGQEAAAKADPARAEQAYLAGARLLDQKNLAAALPEFVRAAALDPARQDYALALALARDQRIGELIHTAAQARLTGRPAEADQLLAQARALDPANELVLQHAPPSATATPRLQLAAHAHELRPGRPGTAGRPEIEFAPPIVLQPIQLLKDVHAHGPARQVVTQAASTFGIRVAFDESFDASSESPPFRFDLEQTTYAQAMPILLRMAHLFAVPVDEKTILIAHDSEAVRGRLERLVQETLYIPGSTPEQLNELTNIVKNVFDVKQISVSPGSGTLLIRAPKDTITAMNGTLADLVDGGAQVLLEVKLISVDKDHTRSTGVTPPTSFSAFSIAAEAQSLVAANQSAINAAIASGALTPTGSTANQTLEEAAFLVLSGVATDARLTNILTFFGNGLTLFAVSADACASFNFGLNTSEARALDDISVRVGDRQDTTLRVGSKYPITTSTYSSGLSNSALAAVAGRTINGVSVSSLISQYAGVASAATVPLVQYEDLGLTLKTTPTVMKSGLIRLHIDFKIEALTGSASDGIPILTQRAFTSDITVEDGASALMLSELSRSEAASVNGIPGLAELPGFKQTVSDELRDVASSELVLVVTPHVVRRRSDTFATRPIRFSSSVPQESNPEADPSRRFLPLRGPSTFTAR